MILPVIHTNGTPKSVLIDALCEASWALNGAYAKLKLTCPNGRDYNSPADMERAVAEHMGRLQLLDVVKRNVDELARAISKIGE